MPVSEDTIWNAIREEVKEVVDQEPLMASYLHATILNHKSLEVSLGFHLANKLFTPTLLPTSIIELFGQAFDGDSSIGESMRADLQAIVDRDPACDKYSTPLLYFKGFQAVQTHRVAHWLWLNDRKHLALLMQSRVSEVFGADIHPASIIGRGVMVDHATGIVVGETAVIKDNVSILHGVTLGGTGKEGGDRHPKIGEGVLIGAHATILGNITIGEGAKIGAGSVVMENIPPHCTAVGVPAEIKGRCKSESPALCMDHYVHGHI
jgi:serine O-acetyltransferase